MALRPGTHCGNEVSRVIGWHRTAGRRTTFVNRRGLSGGRKPGIDGSLTGRSLPCAGTQDVAHVHGGDLLGLEGTARHGGTDGCGAKLRGRDAREGAVELVECMLG